MKRIQTTSRTLKRGLDAAGRGRLGAAALQPLPEEWDRVDLERAEKVPVDAPRAGVRGARRDDLRRRDEEVDREVVGQHGDALGDDLQRSEERRVGKECRL